MYAIERGSDGHHPLSDVNTTHEKRKTERKKDIHDKDKKRRTRTNIHI